MKRIPYEEEGGGGAAAAAETLTAEINKTITRKFIITKPTENPRKRPRFNVAYIFYCAVGTKKIRWSARDTAGFPSEGRAIKIKRGGGGGGFFADSFRLLSLKGIA